MAHRRSEFDRNQRLEALLGPLNEDLGAAEGRAIHRYPASRSVAPPVFIMGAPRSGTTLFMQWLCATEAFACPTNFLSRFWNAPIIGAQIQKILTDPAYDFRGELYDLKGAPAFESDHGKTAGALAPNEFWYFWRRFFPGNEYHPQEYLEQHVDVATLRAEVAGITDVLGAPFATKGMIFNENVPFMAKVFPEAVFVWIRRQPEYTIQSLLMARERQFGDMTKWYSFQIREYPHLKDLDPVESVCGQVASLHNALEEGLAQIPGGRVLTVDYEHFCARPQESYEALRERVREQGIEISPYTGPSAFEQQNRWRMEWIGIETVRSIYEQQCSERNIHADLQ